MNYELRIMNRLNPIHNFRALPLCIEARGDGLAASQGIMGLKRDLEAQALHGIDIRRHRPMAEEATGRLSRGTRFGEWLMQRRKGLDLTRRQLALAVGLSAVAIEKIEIGERRPSRQVAELLARYFGVPEAELEAFVQFARGTSTEFRVPSSEYGQDPTPSAPWRELLRYPNNLPAQATPFIGREALLPELLDLVRRPGLRLLSLTGPPGIGKTRLSLEVGARAMPYFASGVFFVELAAIDDPDLVVPAIARALKVREESGRSPAESLAEKLRQDETLLVLDNFEQVVGAGPAISELLKAAPGLKVLATSREVLRLYGEQDFEVPPMEGPSEGEETSSPEGLERYEAIGLFVERARAVDRSFDLTPDNAGAVARICSGLDYLPLAIELAAARVKSLSPEEIRARLGSRLNLLSGGPRDLPLRQQTLRGAIEWSYDLLDEAEQTVFRGVSVFVGGFTVASASPGLWGMSASGGRSGVGDPISESGGPGSNLPVSSETPIPDPRSPTPFDLLETLESLVSKSLLRSEQPTNGEPRFRMLETIREYGLERLRESGEEQERRAAHAAYFLGLVEEASEELRGPRQAEWVARLEAAHDNMRAAIQWAVVSGEAETALRLSAGLRWFWYLRNYLSEGRHWLKAALGASPDLRTPARAEALTSLGVLAQLQGDYQEAMRDLGESLAMFRERADRDGAARVLNNMGAVAMERGDREQAEACYTEALGIWREAGSQVLAGAALHNLSILAYARGEHERALELCRECLAIMESEGRLSQAGRVLTTIGEIYRLQGNYEAAAANYERSLAILRELGDIRGTSPVLMNLGHVDHHRGRLDQAEAHIADALDLDVEAGDRGGISLDLAALAGIAASRGQPERAARLFAAADALREALGITYEAPDQVEYDRGLAAARAQLPADSWDALRAEGRAMTMEQAVEYALAAQPRKL
jgi:predicted ATPase/DNA-binding XRE family transcriptional regulator